MVRPFFTGETDAMAYSTREAFDAIQRASCRSGSMGDFHVRHDLVRDGVRIRVMRTRPALTNEISRTVAWLDILAARPELDVLNLTLVEMIQELIRAGG